MFYEIFTKLCNKIGLSPTETLKRMNLSTSKLTAWKNGSIPNGTTLLLISEFFDVSIDYLLTGLERNSPTDDFSQNEIEMLGIFKKFDDREQIKLSGKLEELYRQKQIKENQKTVAIKIARSSDGKFRKTELTAEELERIENLPEDTDF